MPEIKTTEILHDRDWQVNKMDDSVLDNTLRYRRLFRIIQKYDPKTIFDIGSGSGVLGRIIKQWKPNTVIHGCDISTSALERAENHYEKVWETDLDKGDIPTGPSLYDLVICGEVLEHVYDVNHILFEIKRILKKGGVAILTVPNLVYWRYRIDILLGKSPIPVRDDRHIHQFTQNTLTKKITEARLKILAVSGCSIKLPFLADWKPSIFSDTLFFEIR